jgi:acyl carrier protein
MMNVEVVERIQLINSEIYKFFESEIMWASMDEYLSSSELVMLLDKLEERYGFAYESEEAVASTVQGDNVRRYIWVGIQKIEISGYKTLRVIVDLIVAAIAEEVDIVNLESSYYKELIPDFLEWTCREEQPNTFA